jgi:hypothetical protein
VLHKIVLVSIAYVINLCYTNNVNYDNNEKINIEEIKNSRFYIYPIICSNKVKEALDKLNLDV